MMIRALLASLCAVLFLATPVMAKPVKPDFVTAPDIFEDSRAKEWAKDWNNGNRRKVIKAVRADLEGKDPHPGAPHILVMALNGPAPAEVPPAARDMAEIYQIYRTQDWARLQTAFPPSRLEQIDDPFALLYAAFALNDADLDDLAHSTALRLAEIEPGFYGAVWRNDGLDYLKFARKRIAENRDNLRQSKAGQAILNDYDHPVMKAGDRLSLLDTWLIGNPLDTRALRRRGHELQTLGLFKEALKAYQKADAAWPWYSNAPKRIDTLVRLQRFDEAEQLAKDLALRDTGDEGLSAKAKIYAQGLRMAGEYGRAREEISTALTKDPDNLELLAVAATIEEKVERWQDMLAITARARALDPNNPKWFEREIRARRGLSQWAEIYEIFMARRAEGLWITTSSHYAMHKAIENLNRHGDAPALITDLEKQGVRSAWMYRNYATTIHKGGDSLRGFDLLSDYIDRAAPSLWYLNRLHEMAAATGRENDLTLLLSKLKKNWPHVEDLWTFLAKQEKEQQGKQAVWAEAAKANPNLDFPAMRAARDLRGKNFANVGNAIPVLSAAIDAAEQADNMSDSHLGELYRTRGWYYDEAIRLRHSGDRDLLNLAEADFRRGHDLNKDRKAFARSMYYLLNRMGRKNELGPWLQEMMILDPDSRDWQQYFINPMRSIAPSGTNFRELYRWYQRRPKNKERLDSLVHRHQRWGGSPVVALRTLEEKKKLYPDSNIEDARKEAFSKLGMHKDYYLARYNNSRILANSLRYVGWFESARNKAQQDGNVLKRLDLENYGVTVTRPDGMELERRYHPISGRLTYARLGAASIEVTYTDSLKLQSMKAGDQILFDLSYAPSNRVPGEEVITRVALQDGRSLTMIQDDYGVMETWTIKDVGQMEVQRKPDGEIVRTNVTQLEEGRKEFEIASQLSSIMSEVKEATELVRQGYENITGRLPLNDAALDALRDQMDDAIVDDDGRDWRKLALKTADYLSQRLADHPDYGPEAIGLAEEIWFQAKENQNAADALEAVALWHRVNRTIRPDGLPVNSWIQWAQMISWIDTATAENRLAARDVNAVQSVLRKNPLQLLEGQNWLDRSYLSNDGYWRHYPAHTLFPRSLGDDVNPRDVVARNNGDVVVSSGKGLAVFQRGFWTWLAWNETEKRFAPSLDYNAADISSIDAMAEDAEGRLWLARGGEILILGTDYRARPQIWRSVKGDGPNGPAIRSFTAIGNDMLVGSNNGAWHVTAGGETSRLPHIPDDANITHMRVFSDWSRNEQYYMDAESNDVALDESNPPEFWHIFAMSDNLGAFHQGFATATPTDPGPMIHGKLHDAWLTDIWFDATEERLMAIEGNKLLTTPFTGQKSADRIWQPLAGQADIQHAGKIFGFTSIYDEEWNIHPAVLTDLGVNIWRNWHFEYLKVPGQDRQQPVFAASTGQDGNLWLMTGNGMDSIERGQVSHPISSRIFDVLYDKAGKRTWFTTDSALYSINEDNTGDEPVFQDNIRARVLAMDEQGRLYANDGTSILRYDTGGKAPTILFDTTPSQGNNAWPSAILPASDGTIWVTAGPSLWQHKDGETREFNIYDTAGPGAALNSNQLANVIETHDGRIWVVASNEGHLTANGVSMRGGVFEWTGSIFRKPKEYSRDNAGNWFINSYTKVATDRAIITTNAGFSLHQGDRVTAYSTRQDVSYDALRDKQPALFQGKRPGKVDDNFHLYPTAGGIIAHYQGQWLALDRLNKMLPAQHLANYGARAVHGLAVDGRGRVIAGTDQGLMVYDPRGAGAEAFLIGEGMNATVSSNQEQGKLREVSERLIKNMDSKSPAGKLARRIQKLNDEIAEAKKLLNDPNLQLPEEDPTGKDGKKNELPSRKKLQKALRKKEKSQLGLIAKLERNHPAMFQMLQINPLDLRAIGQKLDDDVVLVQYMPTEDQLFVNLVTADGAELRKIAVDRDDLMGNAALVSRSLAEQVRGLDLRGDGRNATRSDDSEDGSDDVIELVFEEMSESELRTAEANRPSLRHARQVTSLNSQQSLQALSWLYEILLRPIEHELAGKDRVYIVPAGSLNYLPFAALVSDLSNPQEPRYAVEDFTMAVLPTLYTWDLVQQKDPSTALSSLIYGDSDGTLPAARQEAAEIAEILGEDEVELRIGEEADLDNLETLASDARYLHLAVHGKLNRQEPENSWLTMAGNKRLGLTDAMLLDLKETELVFLSACETGIGKDGLEFRTLAQAFAHAGAPSVVASLWEVNDEATRHLALSFYETLAGEEPIPTALATAQRAMIAEGGALSHPSAWAPFLLFGGK